MLVGYPFAFFPRVIEIEHRRHGIDPQAIDMKTIAPVQCVSGQEITNLLPAKVKNIRAPVGMLATPRIGVLVQRCAVESG